MGESKTYHRQLSACHSLVLSQASFTELEHSIRHHARPRCETTRHHRLSIWHRCLRVHQRRSAQISQPGQNARPRESHSLAARLRPPAPSLGYIDKPNPSRGRLSSSTWSETDRSWTSYHMFSNSTHSLFGRRCCPHWLRSADFPFRFKLFCREDT